MCLFELMQNNKEGEEDFFDEVIQGCDCDGDGRIDYQEFLQATLNQQMMLNKDNVKIVFDMFDNDKDGMISR